MKQRKILIFLTVIAFALLLMVIIVAFMHELGQQSEPLVPVSAGSKQIGEIASKTQKALPSVAISQSTQTTPTLPSITETDLNPDVPLIDRVNTGLLQSPNIVLLGRSDGQVLYERDANVKIAPASLTKMMTVLVALEQIGDLSAVAPVDVETYQTLVEMNASMAGFYGNEPVTYRDLLYGTMLASGGEAATTLAIRVAGSVDTFVELMNQKAAALGLTDTVFKNPTGLDQEGQYTTALDMANLLNFGLQNQNFRTIITTSVYRSSATEDHPEGVEIISTVLGRLTQNSESEFQVLGGKSGTTLQAGLCWATFAQKQGKEYICIAMGAVIGDINEPQNGQIADTLYLYQLIS